MENSVTEEGQCYKWRTTLQRKDGAINGEQHYKRRTLLPSTIGGEKRYKWRTTLQRKDSAINGEQRYRGRTVVHWDKTTPQKGERYCVSKGEP